MTHEDSLQLMSRIQRREQEFGFLLIGACLCAGILIAMVLV